MQHLPFIVSNLICILRSSIRHIFIVLCFERIHQTIQYGIPDQRVVLYPGFSATCAKYAGETIDVKYTAIYRFTKKNP
jgi:hypothetical protein